MTQLNTFNQKLGTPVPNWKTRQLPGKVVLQGKSCIVEPLDSNKHALELFESYKKAGNDSIWTYVPIGPFSGPEDYKEAVSRMSASGNTHFAILSKETGRAIGQFCLMRADPANGVVEVGHVIFSSDLQRTTMATEAHYLLMKHVFETLKYRRYEWKCDSLNTPSRNAAERLGFQFEGTFRQAVIMKGRNRDTHWLSIIDSEWNFCRQAFEYWLSEENFEGGRQKTGLKDIRSRLLKEGQIL